MIHTRCLCASLLALLVTGCDDVEAGAARLRAEGARALERFEAERLLVEAELEQHLTELNDELLELRRELELQSEARLEGLVAELEEQRELARAKLAELQAAGHEALEQALEEARVELEELRQRSDDALADD